MTAPPRAQPLPAREAAPFRAAGRVADAVAAGSVAVTPVWLGTKGVLLTSVEEAEREGDLTGVELADQVADQVLDVESEVEVEVSVATVAVIVGMAVGVGVLVEQSPVTVTAIQLMSLAARVFSTVRVPWEAEQEAKVVPSTLQETNAMLRRNVSFVT